MYTHFYLCAVHNLQSQPVIYPSSSIPATVSTAFVLNSSSAGAVSTRNEMFSAAVSYIAKCVREIFVVIRSSDKFFTFP